MKYLMIFLISLQVVHANELDVKLSQINKALNPVKEGQTGLYVDYIQGKDHDGLTWVNILKVKYGCSVQEKSYIKNGQLKTTVKQMCKSSAIFDGSESPLYQIQCEGIKGRRCLQTLAKEITADLINKMVLNKMPSAYVVEDKK